MSTDPDDYFGETVECWNCGGEGFVSSCFEEFACIDPESGCDDCTRCCDICRGKGGWPAPDPTRLALAQKDPQP